MARDILSSRGCDGLHDPVADMSALLGSHTGGSGAADMGRDDGMDRWEVLAVGLNLTDEHLRGLLKKNDDEVYTAGPRSPDLVPEDDAAGGDAVPPLDEVLLPFLDNVLVPALTSNFEHAEPRVRTLVARVMGAHSSLTAARPSGGLARQRLVIYGHVVKTLRREVERGRIGEEAPSALPGVGDLGGRHALDDTTGWRATETSLQALASLVGGWRGHYVEDVGMETVAEAPEGELSLLSLLDQCASEHVNRHVRAAALQCVEQIVRDVRIHARGDDEGCEDDDASPSPHLSDGSPLRRALTHMLATGLSDNWSQVRMAASVLAREVLVRALGPGKRAKRRKMFPDLLPRLAMNRFYLAQGVRLYSIESWRLMFGENDDKREGGDAGMREVAAQAEGVVKYYANMCDADNHVVREAGCQAIAELAIRIGPSCLGPYLAPHVSSLLRALLLCFQDESWPVRDEACLACGTFAAVYPDLCRPDLETLYDLWFLHLRDPIWSVREDAARALGDAVRAYGTEAIDRCVVETKELLPCARDQPKQTRMEMIATHNDAASHTNLQLYSCGSLAPKMRKGAGRVAGCGDCLVTRPAYPYEKTDGAIYMIRELCSFEACKDGTLLPLMEELADVCRVRHFPQGDDLRATLWRALPIMADRLGKRRFKAMYLEVFMDLLFRSLDWGRDSDGGQASRFAAERCVWDLADLVGTGLFRGRLEDWMVPIYEECMACRQAQGSGVPPCGQGAVGLTNGSAFPPTPVPGRIPF